MIVGLTGGIGSGKSVAGDFFIELGIDVIDADHLSKNILDENVSAKKLFLEHFGEKFIDKNNSVDRALLRDEIFKNEDKKEALESIIHPLVREEIFNFIENSKSVYKIIMVPLIYETNSQDFYDKIVVVDCKEENTNNQNINPATITRDGVKVGRNEIISITNGTETKEMKYKKAKPLIDSGEWRIS